MIARDEEEWIARALGSVKDLVDEMIVVDTGSRDRTASEARRAGARVFAAAWNDDFSEARNAALDRASKEWILVLDADEEIALADHERIRGLIAGNPEGAFLFDRRTYSNASTAFGWVPARPHDGMARGSLGFFRDRQARLFRNDPGIRFAGALHESVEAELASRGVPVREADIIVHHYGRIGESTRVHRKTLVHIARGCGRPDGNPRGCRCLYEMAAQLLALGRRDEAIDHARRGLDIEPASWELWNVLGLALLAGGETAEAIEAFREAIARGASVADPHAGLGAALMERGEHEAALGAFVAGLAAAPASADLLRSAASACAALGRHGAALEFAGRSLEIDPFSPRTHAVRAEILCALGDEEGARRALEKLRFLSDIPLGVRLKAIRLSLRMEMTDEAERLLAGAMAAHPERDSLVYLAGKIAERRGDDERAIARFRKALALDPTNAEIANSLGCAYERHGRFEEALRSFREAHRLSPRDPRIEVNLGISLDRIGARGEAERHFLNVLAGGEASGFACNAFGCHLAGAGRYEDAASWFARAVERDAGNAAFRRNLGLARDRLLLPRGAPAAGMAAVGTPEKFD